MTTQPPRKPSKVASATAIVLGVAVAAVAAWALPAALAVQSEKIDQFVAMVVLGAALAAIGALDYREATSATPRPAAERWGGRIARVAALAAFGTCVYRGMPDESIQRRETSAMVRALDRLAQAESAYHAGNGAYTRDLALLQTSVNYHLSDTTLTVTQADSTGWSGTASSLMITRTCSVAMRRTARGPQVDGPRCPRVCTYKLDRLSGQSC